MSWRTQSPAQPRIRHRCRASAATLRRGGCSARGRNSERRCRQHDENDVGRFWLLIIAGWRSEGAEEEGGVGSQAVVCTKVASGMVWRAIGRSAITSAECASTSFHSSPLLPLASDQRPASYPRHPPSLSYPDHPRISLVLSLSQFRLLSRSTSAQPVAAQPNAAPGILRRGSPRNSHQGIPLPHLRTLTLYQPVHNDLLAIPPLTVAPRLRPTPRAPTWACAAVQHVQPGPVVVRAQAPGRGPLAAQAGGLRGCAPIQGQQRADGAAPSREL